MNHYRGVVMPVGSDSFDKFNEGAAWLWDPVLRPWRVVEVANQNVVSMLHRVVTQGIKLHIGIIIIYCLWPILKIYSVILSVTFFMVRG